MKHRLFILSIILVTSFATLQAQPYEIRAVNKGNGYVGVEIRATGGTAPTTGDYVTDLVFGVRWLVSYNVDLVNTFTSDYHIVKSGGRTVKGIYYFQAFSADNTPFLFPANWSAGNWVEILSIRNTLTGSGEGTFDITESGFDVTTEPNVGVSLADFTPTIGASATMVFLPVTLTGFEATPRGSNIVLNWNTPQEQNAKGFEIERSDEGVNTGFANIGWMESKGNAGGKYEWADTHVLSGIKYYYRLKQVDLNNNFRYSEVRTAQLHEPGGNAMRLMPNPADRVLQVSFDGTVPTGKLLLKVIDAKGTVVMQRSHDLNTSRKVELPVVSLAQGQYILSVENGKGVLFTKPFLKQ